MCHTLSSLPPNPLANGSIQLETIHYCQNRDVSLGFVGVMRSLLQGEVVVPSVPVGPMPGVTPGLPAPANKEDLARGAMGYLPQHIHEVETPPLPSFS